MTTQSPNIRETLDNAVLQELADVLRELSGGSLLGWLIQDASWTQSGIVPVDDVATLAADAKEIFDLESTAGTFTGRLALLIGGPSLAPSSGQAVWAGPGSSELRLFSGDAITALRVKYARSDAANTKAAILERNLTQRD